MFQLLLIFMLQQPLLVSLFHLDAPDLIGRCPSVIKHGPSNLLCEESFSLHFQTNKIQFFWLWVDTYLALLANRFSGDHISISYNVTLHFTFFLLAHLALFELEMQFRVLVQILSHPRHGYPKCFRRRQADRFIQFLQIIHLPAKCFLSSDFRLKNVLKDESNKN